jgi:hypothetical protein
MLRRRPVMRAAVGTAVVAGTATAVSGRVARRQEESAAAAPGPDLKQLKELATLRDQGVLTDEEFAAQKAKILAS